MMLGKDVSMVLHTCKVSILPHFEPSKLFCVSEEDTKEKGKLYKPTSRLEEKSSADQAQEYARLLGERGKPERPGKKKEREKRKSNLELFKEELKT